MAYAGFGSSATALSGSRRTKRRIPRTNGLTCLAGSDASIVAAWSHQASTRSAPATATISTRELTSLSPSKAAVACRLTLPASRIPETTRPASRTASCSCGGLAATVMDDAKATHGLRATDRASWASGIAYHTTRVAFARRLSRRIAKATPHVVTSDDTAHGGGIACGVS